MASSTLEVLKKRHPGRKPAWDMALLFPDQGGWTEDDYLELSGNQLVEFTNGRVEVLPMPSPYHQTVSLRLLRRLDDFVSARKLGMMFHAPVPLRVGVAKYREPDLAYVSTAKLPKTLRTERRLTRADLVVEIVSGGSEGRRRDFVKKRAEYAAARVPEYWIVDPEDSEVTVLKLRSGKYVEFGRFGVGEEIQSAVLPEFRMAVRELF